MELRPLRSFVAIAEEGSFSAAARRLRIAQPALTRQIQDLEGEVGTPLLWRTRRGAKPTPAGALLLEDARRLLRQAGEAAAAARSAALGEAGRLRIGFFGPATAPFLPLLVRAFRERHRTVRIELIEMTPAEQAEHFRLGLIDFGFNRRLAEGEAERLGLAQEVVYRDRLVAALPAGHRLAKGRGAARRLPLAALAREPFVLVSRKEAPVLADQMLSACVGAGFSPDVRAEARLMSTVLLFVACGIGVSLVSGSAGRTGPPDVVFREIAPASPPIDLVAFWDARYPSATAAAFREVVRGHLPEIRKIMCVRYGACD